MAPFHWKGRFLARGDVLSDTLDGRRYELDHSAISAE